MFHPAHDAEINADRSLTLGNGPPLGSFGTRGVDLRTVSGGE